jgi:hypothetical protein
VSTVALDPDRVAHFAELLRAHRGKRIPEKEIWDAFAKAFPYRPMGAAERGWLRSALDALAEAGVLALPAERSTYWDRSMDPPLPQLITRIDAPVQRRESWRGDTWHPFLSWIPGMPRLAEDQVYFLHRIQDALVDGSLRTPAPLRYRSLQLTGDEKRLERHMTTVLFGEGRLSLEMLNLYHDVLPLAWERVGPGGAVLVFENSAPFSVARSVLSAMENPPYGIVAYGAGRCFIQSVEHLLSIGCEVSSIDYVGDLDEPGLEIAKGAQETARKTGVLPIVCPAPGLHKMMLDAAERFGHPHGWPDAKRTGLSNPSAADVLPADIRSRVLEIIAVGRRIPEEVLGPEEMKAAWGSERE